MPRSVCLVALSFACWPALLSAEDVVPPKPAEAKVDMSLDEMRGLMQRTKVELLKGGSEPREAKLLEKPVFRYSDEPKFIRDSTLWIWEDEDGRPVAIQKIENNFFSAQNPTWTYCFASLTEQEKVKFAWPNAPAVELTKLRTEFVTLKDGPKPSDDEANWDRQFRQVARMFSVKSFHKEDNFKETLRLLPQPVHEYKPQTLGVLAGKIFGLASGTNPDTLLMIELVESKADGKFWRYAPVQMTSIGVALFKGEEKLWTGMPAKPRTFDDANWAYMFLSRQ